MAYWIDPTEKSVGNKKSFYCDTTSDIADMPTSSSEGVPQTDTVAHKVVAPGSDVYVISEAKMYILNSLDNWVEQ